MRQNPNYLVIKGAQKKDANIEKHVRDIDLSAIRLI